mmetsp:Transcript_39444/g.88227  ORF Transcript_39444/g.88227 Transcript_39444/m.88227 type:complete len:225 (-) Transcript_39444:59-733(-)
MARSRVLAASAWERIASYETLPPPGPPTGSSRPPGCRPSRAASAAALSLGPPPRAAAGFIIPNAAWAAPGAGGGAVPGVGGRARVAVGDMAGGKVITAEVAAALPWWYTCVAVWPGSVASSSLPVDWYGSVESTSLLLLEWPQEEDEAEDGSSSPPVAFSNDSERAKRCSLPTCSMSCCCCCCIRCCIRCCIWWCARPAPEEVEEEEEAPWPPRLGITALYWLE